MGSIDWFNFFAYVLIMIQTSQAWEPFVYAYNRIVIALRDV